MRINLRLFKIPKGVPFNSFIKISSWSRMENGTVIAIPFELQTKQKLPIWMWNECFAILIICCAKNKNKNEYELLAFKFSQILAWKIRHQNAPTKMRLAKGNVSYCRQYFVCKLKFKLALNVHFQIEWNRVEIKYVWLTIEDVVRQTNLNDFSWNVDERCAAYIFINNFARSGSFDEIFNDIKLT